MKNVNWGKIPKVVKGIVTKEDVGAANKQCNKDRMSWDKGIITEDMKKRGWI